jgi:DNA-binding transcriptional MerR regulator
LAKSAEAFRTISEAADELGVAQHVLRFWETKFSFIRPMKRAGGRRFYRPSDIAVLATIRRLLHHDGYTIKGVQKLYRQTGLRLAETEASEPGNVQPRSLAPHSVAQGEATARMKAALGDLIAAKARLDRVLGGA